MPRGIHTCGNFVNHRLRNVLTIACCIPLLFILLLAYLIYWPRFDRDASARPQGNSISFFALGDQGSGDLSQWRVAHAMEKVAAEKKGIDFVALLGDNFYGKGLDSVNDTYWVSRFENVYTSPSLNGVPFYAVLGNHDHTRDPAVQIAYSRQHLGSGRFHMPDYFYSEDFGNIDGKPLLRIVFIDTILEADGLKKEAAFIEHEFSKAGPAPIWRMVVGHYPIRNYGNHGETANMIPLLLPALQRAHVDAYLSGHDHDQQVIARDGEPLYVISGGGGGPLNNINRKPKDLLFARSMHGFVGIDAGLKNIILTLYDINGYVESTFHLDRDCTGQVANCLKPM